MQLNSFNSHLNVTIEHICFDGARYRSWTNFYNLKAARSHAITSRLNDQKRGDMSNQDEPLFDDENSGVPTNKADPSLKDQIERLVQEQEYAVLCVQGDGQPYGALVAFAFSDDLRHAVFATPMATRKYRLLSTCDHVALVIDNRPNMNNEMMEVEAITATGHAQMIERGDEFDEWAGLLLARHPYLKPFVQAESCALFRIDIVRFFHVIRFQEVRQWIPPDHS